MRSTPGERVADRLRLVEVSPTNGGAAIGEVREGLGRAGQEHNVAGVESVDDEPRRLAAEVARCTGDGNDHRKPPSFVVKASTNQL